MMIEQDKVGYSEEEQEKVEMEPAVAARLFDSGEEQEKVKILRAQLERVRHNETESEMLKAEIRRRGYSPDKRTW